MTVCQNVIISVYVQFNTQQSTFISGALEKLREYGWWTLQGNAGTGKTTCLIEIYKYFRNIVFLAPTHKAKGVLQAKLGPDAYVITTTSFTKGFRGTLEERIENKIEGARHHGDEKLIKTLEKELRKLVKSGRAQEPVFGDRERDDPHFISVVCDEASMVDLDSRNLIIENSDSAIFIGDGFQLPPVTRNVSDEEAIRQDWFYRTTHTWHLTEVVRQAEDSGILRLAGLIRDKGGNSPFPIWSWMRDNEHDWDDLYVLDENTDCYQKASDDDTVMLSFMNNVVDEFCYDVRHTLGRDPNVVTSADKLYASNNFANFSNKDEIQVRVESFTQVPTVTVPLTNITKGMWECCLVNSARLQVDLTDRERRERLSLKGLVLRYDYARTIHSSQGSEWDYVMYRHAGVDRLDSLTHNRLLYTAVTRAKESFILLK